MVPIGFTHPYAPLITSPTTCRNASTASSLPAARKYSAIRFRSSRASLSVFSFVKRSGSFFGRRRLHREPGYERVDALLADVEAAGSWAVYAREPHRKMLVLAKLCEKGRATPPRRDRVLGALFDGGSRRRGAAVVIPREVFWKVFEFWPCSH